tara:strand:- start:786 stop:4118 length:3333 start_codon:yes stop_codon:yes gene_type:complete
MPIPINLKQILQSDTQQEKLDKVNYNFDQLVANGGGPMGVAGDIGETGLQGVTGDQGPQGILGTQGTQGPADESNESLWKAGGSWSIGSLNVKTIIPIHDVTSTNNNPPTNIILGLANNDAEYADPAQQSAFSHGVLLINRNSNYHNSNIRLFAEANFNDYLDIILTHEAGLAAGTDKSVLEFKFNNSTQNSEYRWNADKYIINDVNGNEMMSMDSIVGTTFTGSFLSNSDAVFTGSIFRINNGTGTPAIDPDVDKIAVALDTDGTIGFKTAVEIGAGVPVGTIISFHHDTYIDVSNFTQTQTIDLNVDPSTINITVGRGIAGTQYEGWYLCNGQTWKNNDRQYTVPNLNSFSVNFSTSIGSITSPPSVATPNLLGGGEFEFSQNATTVSYTIDVDSTNAWLHTAPMGPGSDYKVIKTPQLIYLGDIDLWYNVLPHPPVSVGFYSAGKADILAVNNSWNSWAKPSSAPVNSQFEFVNTQLRMDTFDSNLTYPGLTKNLINRIDPVLILDDDELDFSASGVNIIGENELVYGQDAVLTIQVKAKPYYVAPSGQNQIQSQYASLYHYSWFVNWNEYRLPNPAQPTGGSYTPPDPLFVTGEWNDRGEWDASAVYYAGDVFWYAYDWYTINPMLAYVGGFGSGTAIVGDIYGNTGTPNYNVTNPIGSQLSHSSWAGMANYEGIVGYYVKLPDSSEFTTPTTPYSSFMNASPFGNSGTSTHPNQNGYGMGLSKFEGCYDKYRTSVPPQGSTTDEWYDTETGTPIYPPGIQWQTGDPLNSRKGIYTQPMQVAIDPVANDGISAANQVLLPVVNTFNISEIQSQYPGLNITANDTVQYLDPYSYDETSDHWTAIQYTGAKTTNGVTSNPKGPYYYGFKTNTGNPSTDKYMATQGGYDVNLSGTNATSPSNGALNVHAWRYGQEDTMFRRYQTIEFKVILDSSVVDQILNYSDANPGENIKLLLGHYLYAVGDGQEQDYWDYAPGNIQPLGGNNKRNTQATVNPNFGTPNALTTTSSGTAAFLVSDYVGGAGSGSDTVPYNISPNTAAPTVVAGTWALYFTITVGAPDANGNGIITLNSVMPCTNNNAFSNPISFTIEHPSDSSLTVTYNGYYTKAPC